MNTLLKQQPGHTGTTTPTAAEVRQHLDDELVRALGLLYKAPRGIPELALASLSYGSRMAL